MQVGDLIQVKNHNWGEQPDIGLVTTHMFSKNGIDVWGILLNNQENLQYYMSHELLVLNESR